MENEFVPYEQALVLKELGFDEPCFGFYTYKGEIRRYTNFDGEYNEFQTIKNSEINVGQNWCTSPLYQQAFRWFREKYNLLGNVYSNASGWLWEIHDNEGGTHRCASEWSGDCEESGMFTSFEKSELECLKKLITNKIWILEKN